MDTSLEEQLAAVNTLYNELRLKSDADPAAVEDAKKKLGELKKAVAVAKAKEAGSSGPSKEDGKKKERLLLKTGKGTRDYGPAEMFCRLHIESIVRDCFTTYGGSCLDTPVFERTDLLMGKYGEDTKLIFDLQDQGGEQLSLRYDHTVPLARYLAMQGGAAGGQSKLWQIGKVYRRDNPVMSKGRMREFSQADFDISGVWDPMIPDAEIISLVCSILSKLDVGTFTIKLNHRKILDGVFEVCGVPKEKIRAISSAVDKLDKSPWADVRKEMTVEKGLDPAVADKIGQYVKDKGALDLLEKLQNDVSLMANASAKKGLEEMALLFRLLDAYNVADKISFDMSLARGLDYYTGIIYEAVVAASAPPNFAAANALASTSTSTTDAPSTGDTSKPPTSKSSKDKKKSTSAADEDENETDANTVGVGSIAAGGRYDNLVGDFASAASGKKIAPSSPANVPCIGVSIGMDRVFAQIGRAHV